MFKKITSFIILMVLAVSVSAQDTPATVPESCVADYDAEVDYFEDKIEVAYSEGFEVEYFNNYKVVTVLRPWQFAEEAFTYVLVQCGTPIPHGFDDATIIDVPVQSMVAMSTTILPHLDNQGVLDALIGVDTTLYTFNEAVLAGVENGDIIEIGGGASMDAMNTEVLLDTAPDIVMMQQFFSGAGTIETLSEAGLTPVLNADFVDTTPLGQAEWGKFISVFFNTEAAASDAFDAIEANYQELAALVSDIDEADRPTVQAGTPFDGTWYMAAGDSYLAALLNDAGASYLWADEPGSSVPVDFEAAFERGVDADVWVNINQFWLTTDDMLADDERYADFAAFQSGALWNNNLITNANGGNAYFETGVANPDVLLADLIAILYPELMEDHEFVYYQRLTDGE
ncbi:MAG: ABC transporter substrate-binding protein [Aggregatilineales bacterium]